MSTIDIASLRERNTSIFETISRAAATLERRVYEQMNSLFNKIIEDVKKEGEGVGIRFSDSFFKERIIMFIGKVPIETETSVIQACNTNMFLQHFNLESSQTGKSKESLHSALKRRIFARFQYGSLNEVIKDCDRLLNENLQHQDAREVRYFRARALLVLGKYDEALTEITKASNMHSGDAPNLVLLKSLYYCAAGKREEGLKYFMEISSTLKMDVEVQKLVGEQKFEEAIKIIFERKLIDQEGPYRFIAFLAHLFTARIQDRSLTARLQEVSVDSFYKYFCLLQNIEEATAKSAEQVLNEIQTKIDTKDRTIDKLAKQITEHILKLNPLEYIRDESRGRARAAATAARAAAATAARAAAATTTTTTATHLPSGNGSGVVIPPVAAAAAKRIMDDGPIVPVSKRVQIAPSEGDAQVFEKLRGDFFQGKAINTEDLERLQKNPVFFLKATILFGLYYLGEQQCDKAMQCCATVMARSPKGQLASDVLELLDRIKVLKGILQ